MPVKTTADVAAPLSANVRHAEVTSLVQKSMSPGLSELSDFSALTQKLTQLETVAKTITSVKSNINLLSDIWDTTIASANTSLEEQNIYIPEPMRYDEARLWLQAFNAGPYALLKYKGTVPYRETRNYIPRVMKNYQKDLSNTPYEPYILTSSRKYGLDPQMIRAIMKTESDFRIKTVSNAGARGLMQVMPAVWSEIKRKYDLDWDYRSEVFEPEKNIEVACAYLAWLRYDFLPRHFEAFEYDPAAPQILVRDKERGVPDRKSPRLTVDYPDADKRRNIVFMPQTPASPHSIVFIKDDSPITLMVGKTSGNIQAPVQVADAGIKTAPRSSITSVAKKSPAKITMNFVDENNSLKARKSKSVAGNSGNKKRPAVAGL